MDDYHPLIFGLAKRYRRLSQKWTYRGQDVRSPADGNSWIAARIRSANALLVSRIGASEAIGVAEFRRRGAVSDSTQQRLLDLSGVFPCEDRAATQFCETYLDAIGQSDLIGIWSVTGEAGLIRDQAPTAVLAELRALEPYYHSDPWTVTLRGKRVLVIHPFARLIESQYAQRKHLFADDRILPEFQSLQCLPAVQSIGGHPDFSSWAEALKFQKVSIQALDFDIALIGAGAYGLPLGAYVKSMGKQAIQM